VHVDGLVKLVENAHERGKSSSIVIVAEGAYPGGALALQKDIAESCGYEARTSILGHMQRGGSPSTRDRVLASRLGYAAVNALIEGHTNVMIGVDKRITSEVPLQDIWTKKKEIDWELLEVARVLAI
jgi:6-phosphofructokinase 1